MLLLAVVVFCCTNWDVEVRKARDRVRASDDSRGLEEDTVRASESSDEEEWRSIEMQSVEL